MAKSNSFIWTPGIVSATQLPAFTQRLYFESQQLGQVIEQTDSEIESIADVGAGFGRLLPVELIYADSVIAFEREPAMVDSMQRYYSDDPDVRVDARLARSLAQLDAPDASVDLALTFTVLQHMSDQDAFDTVQELKRISSRWVLIVEDTDPSYHYRDKANKAHFTHGRAITTYEEYMSSWKLVHAVPRRVENTYKGAKGAAYVGHYMLFEKTAKVAE